MPTGLAIVEHRRKARIELMLLRQLHRSAVLIYGTSNSKDRDASRLDDLDTPAEGDLNCQGQLPFSPYSRKKGTGLERDDMFK